MTSLRFRHASALACSAILSGCNSIVVEHAKLDADLPLAPAAIMPDSASFGDVAIQGSLRVSDGTAWSDSVYNWSNGKFGGYGQVQMAISRNFRVIGGGGYGSTPSYWFGAASSNKFGSIHFDVDLLLGYTRQTHYLIGYDSYYRYNNSNTTVPDSLRMRDNGTAWSSWMNLALRVRSVGSGPWAEMRFLPGFEWGSLKVRNNASERLVNTSAYAISVGWLQNFEDGSSLMVGPRATQIDRQSVPDFQLMASLQLPLKL